MKRTLCPISAALLAFLPLTRAAAADPAAPTTNAAAGPAARLEALFPDPVLARGRGLEIRRSHLDAAIINIKAEAAGRGVAPPPFSEGQVLNELIHLQLLWNKATVADRARARERFAQSLTLAKTNANLSEEAFARRLEAHLKAQGLTREQWEQQALQRAAIQPVLERELNIAVPEEEVRKYYDENPARFEEPERVRASHLLLRTVDPATRRELSATEKEAKRAKLQELLKRARAGEDFAALVREFSEDVASRERGGEYTFARGEMVPEFEAVAFSLPLNQISDVVTTTYGYHLIKLHERIPARKREFSQVAANIREFLKQQAIEKQTPAYLEKLRQEAGVEILDEKLKLASAAALLPVGGDPLRTGPPTGSR